MSETGRTALLLTGRPGVGKTTVIRKAARGLEPPVEGFYTEEIREDGDRKGFRLVGFDGWSRIMAHVDFRGGPRVSRYGVDVEAVDEAVARLPPAGGAGPEADAPPEGKLDAATGDRRARPAPLHVIDEIGKMECFSEAFVEHVRGLLDSGALLLATVARRGGGFVAEAREHPRAGVLEVTLDNRRGLPERIRARVARKRARASSGGGPT